MIHFELYIRLRMPHFSLLSVYFTIFEFNFCVSALIFFMYGGSFVLLFVHNHFGAAINSGIVMKRCKNDGRICGYVEC